MFSFLTYSQNVEAVTIILLYIFSQLPSEQSIINMWYVLLTLAIIIFITGKPYSSSLLSLTLGRSDVLQHQVHGVRG